MAIVEMQKLSICALKKNRKAILETLQHMGIMEMRMEDLENDPDLKEQDTQTARSKYEKRASAFEEALKILKRYSNDKSRMGLFYEKKEIRRSVLDEAVRNRHQYNVHVSDILSSERKIQECIGIIQKDENMKVELLPWEKLDVPMNMSGTRDTAVLIGTMPGTHSAEEVYAAASEKLGEAPAVYAEVVSAENDRTCLAVVCLSKEENLVEEALRSHGFSRPSQVVNGIPAEVSAGCDRDIGLQREKIKELKEQICSYASEKEYFRLMADYYTTRAEKYRLLGQIPQSENAFFLEGWLPADKADRVASLLTERYGAFVEREEKNPDEMEPTLLKNNRFSEAAEGVLADYGLPQHGKTDPTCIMSVFYVFFFGMMLSDAGYGIVIALLCLILRLKHKNPAPGIRRFLKLFFWCGISTIFWGFMYGGFFGDLIDVIAHTWMGVPSDQTVLKPLWFAPLNNPMRLLIWCMLFGIVHLYTGLGIKGWEMLKDHDLTGFISDIVSWYLFLTGLIFLLLPTDLFHSISGMVFDFPPAVHTAAKVCTIAGAVIILLMSGRSRNNWALRIALGAYGLYGVTGWLSDVLSYSRLLALGLATGVIASVVNMMGSMFGSGAVKVIIFIVVCLLGHTLNIAINTLGAYVHTNRLQYVEFFGKFYEAGGKPFVPFKAITKYTQIKEER
ncbi:MAG: V-type ATP synthase subunit I [Eubacterium sp.]|nr:V-type ATP synthase subunit I [Eubacterium sp.]